VSGSFVTVHVKLPHQIPDDSLVGVKDNTPYFGCNVVVVLVLVVVGGLVVVLVVVVGGLVVVVVLVVVGGLVVVVLVVVGGTPSSSTET
jgi:hypothetical protein